MKALLTSIGLWSALVGLCLALCLPLVPPAFAYDFSSEERALADNPTLSPSNSVPQWQRDAQQAERQSRENDRLHGQIPQFNPNTYNPPSPFGLSQDGGRVQVCRRNASGMVFCQ